MDEPVFGGVHRFLYPSGMRRIDGSLRIPPILVILNYKTQGHSSYG